MVIPMSIYANRHTFLDDPPLSATTPQLYHGNPVGHNPYAAKFGFNQPQRFNSSMYDRKHNRPLNSNTNVRYNSNMNVQYPASSNGAGMGYGGTRAPSYGSPTPPPKPAKPTRPSTARASATRTTSNVNAPATRQARNTAPTTPRPMTLKERKAAQKAQDLANLQAKFGGGKKTVSDSSVPTLDDGKEPNRSKLASPKTRTELLRSRGKKSGISSKIGSPKQAWTERTDDNDKGPDGGISF